MVVVVVLLSTLGSSSAFAVATKTITNTVTVEIANPSLINIGYVQNDNSTGLVQEYSLFESHVIRVASVSSTVLIPVTEIPTLSPVGAIALILFLAGFAWYLSRRRSASP